MANTKAELVQKGKSLGLKLDMKMLKADMESAIKTAETKKNKETAPKSANRGVNGER